MIGTLDERSLHAEVTLKGLEPLARAYWAMTAYSTHPTKFAERFGVDSGTVQVHFPGPVAQYHRRDGHYKLQIFHNGGNVGQTEELYRRLLDYAQK